LDASYSDPVLCVSGVRLRAGTVYPALELSGRLAGDEEFCSWILDPDMIFKWNLLGDLERMAFNYLLWVIDSLHYLLPFLALLAFIA
jgi:hypothetical protein